MRKKEKEYYLEQVRLSGIFKKEMELKQFLKYVFFITEPIVGVNRYDKEYCIFRGTQVNKNSVSAIKNIAIKVGVEKFECEGEKIDLDQFVKKFECGFKKKYNPLGELFSFIPPNYDLLWNLNNQSNYSNQYTLVLGAGVSFSVGLSNWKQLLKKLSDNLFANVEFSTMKKFLENNKLSEKNYLPEKENVSENENLSENSNANPLKLARINFECYKYLNDINVNNNFDDIEGFEKEVTKILYNDYNEKFNDMYNESTLEGIVDLIVYDKLNKVRSIITYNYDDLLELKLNERGIKTVSYYLDRSWKLQKETIEDISPEDNNYLEIFHVHGYIKLSSIKDINEETLSDYIKSRIILTEMDYNNIYSMPMNSNDYIQIDKYSKNTCVFIGVSMEDPNMRRLLDKSKELRRPEAFHYWIDINQNVKKINEFYKNISELKNILYDKKRVALLKKSININYILNEIKKFDNKLSSLNSSKNINLNSGKAYKVFIEFLDCNSFNMYPYCISSWSKLYIYDALKQIIK